MKFIALVLISGFLFSNNFIVFGENDTIPDVLMNQYIKAPYVKFHSLPREQVYIHFNKSGYLPGDNIWFTAYVINPSTGLQSKLTTNLYVELFDTFGKLVEQKILFVKLGIASNVFILNDKQLPGRYTFRAYTNWMKNVGSMEEFDTPLEVLGNVTKKDSLDKLPFIYDVQFFAESGTLLKGVMNRIAIKALNPNGKEVALSGTIIETESGDSIPFMLNNRGMGELILNPSEKSIYKAVVKFSGGKEQHFSFPQVEKRGLVTSVNSFLKQKFIIQIKSNPETIGAGKFFYVLIHKDGTVYHSYSVRLTPEKPDVSFALNKATAGNGVNCLTVFDENFQPVAERLFYNSYTDIKGKIDIEQVVNNDSVRFDISTFDTVGKPISANLSLSVLPQGTASNQFKNSLLAEVLLKSGVRGVIQNPQYYFEKEDFERQKALDILLQTQGWRKYDWKEILAKNKEWTNDFEVGFSISGAAKNSIKGKTGNNSTVSLFSPENKLYRISDVDSTGNFAFPDLFLNDSSRVIVSSYSFKGKNQNRKLTAQMLPNHKIDSVIVVKPEFYISDEVPAITETSLELLKGVVQLKEITITANRKKAPFEGDIYAPSTVRSLELTKDNYWKYPSIEHILRYEFNVNVTFAPGSGEYVIDMGRGSTGFAGIGKNSADVVAIIIDDMRIYDNSYLFNYAVEDIEAIAVNKLENSMIDGANSSIIVKTRKRPIDWGYAQPAYIQKFRIKGYAKAVSYYTPAYRVPEESPTYQKYATVYWKPNIVTDSVGKASFIFHVPSGLKGLEIRTEGISENGNIYLDERRSLIRH